MGFIVVTCNDDFATKATNVPRLLGRIFPGKAAPRHVAVLLVQEAKRERLEDRMPAGYAVRQYDNSEAHAGVAVAWDTAQAHPVSDYSHPANVAGSHGIEPICFPGRGVRMLTRYVVWQDLVIGGRVIRFASYHRPPIRYAHLWQQSDANLRAWLDKSPVPVVLGSDTNTHALRDLAHRLGMRVRGRGIDAVLIRGAVRFGSLARRMAKGSSDHHPVRVTIRLGRWMRRR